MKTKKRMISMILTLALVLSLVPAGTALADEAASGEISEAVTEVVSREEEASESEADAERGTGAGQETETEEAHAEEEAPAEEESSAEEEAGEEEAASGEEAVIEAESEQAEEEEEESLVELPAALSMTGAGLAQAEEQETYYAANGYVTDRYGIMSYNYRNGYYYDINGMFNNTLKQVTYGSRGFDLMISTAGYSNTVRVAKDYQNVGSTGLQAKVEFNHLNYGQTLQVVYTVKNTTDTDRTFSLASGADIQIGSDDGATIEPFSDGSGFKMISRSSYDKDAAGNSAQLNFWCKNTRKVTDVDGCWYGVFYNYRSNYFNDLANKTTLRNTDSGCVWHWKNRTVKAGEETKLSVLFGIGGAGSELAASGLFTTLDATKKIHLEQDEESGEITTDFSDRTFTVKSGNTVFTENEEYELGDTATASPVVSFTKKGIKYLQDPAHAGEQLTVEISDFNGGYPIVIRVDLEARPAGFTVNYDYGYDNITAQEYVAYGGKLTETEPTRAAYDFLGWTTDPEGENSYDFDTEVEEAFTLYANWEYNGIKEEVPVPVLADVAFNSEGVRAVIPENSIYEAEKNRTVFHVGRYPIVLILKDPDCYAWEGTEDSWILVYYNVVDTSTRNQAALVVKSEIKEQAPALSIDGFDTENSMALLEEEEIQAYNAGDNININITMNVDVAETEVIAETGDKELVDAAARAATGCGNPDIMYLDLSVFKTVSVNGGEPETVQIHDTRENVLKISIEIPERMREEGRLYSIIRIHDGVSEVLGSGPADENNCVTIETNKFSTYAIACEQAEIPADAEESEAQISEKWWTGLGEGWILKPGTEEWYFIENDRYATGWHFDGQDGNVYYLDHKTGRMCTGWFFEQGCWYYLNEKSSGSGWKEDEKGEMQYDAETAGRPLGALYKNEKTPDGSTVNERGARVTAE